MSDSLLEEFSVEALDLLEDAEDALLSLESEGYNDEYYNRIFRSFHSMKGSSGMMGLLEIQKHMHLSEDLFQSYKEDHDGLIFNIDFFLRAVDHCKKLLNGEVVSFKYDVEYNAAVEIAKESTDPNSQTNDDNKDEKQNEKFKFMDVFIVDVIGEGFLDSSLYKQYEKNFIVNKIDNLKDYLKDKKFTGSHCLILSDDQLAKLNMSLRDPIPKLVFSSKEASSKRAPGEYALYEEMSGEHLYSHLLHTKHQMSLYNTFDKALKLLYYQYTDLDRYLRDKGREMIRKTLKSEMHTIMQKKNEVYK